MSYRLFISLFLALVLSGCSSLVVNDSVSTKSSPSVVIERQSGGNADQQNREVVAISSSKKSSDASTKDDDSATKDSGQPAANTISRYHRQEDAAADRLLAQARKQLEAGQYSMAVATTERAIRISPNYVHNYITLARIKLSQEQFVEAEQIAEKGLSLLRANRWFFETQEERSLRLIVNRARQEQKTRR